MKSITLTAILFFSIAIYLPVQAQTAADARAMLSAASKQFRALPSSLPILVPPSIVFKCDDLTPGQLKQIDDYVEAFRQPEKLILFKMLSAAKIFTELNNKVGEQAAMDSSYMVSGRLGKKAVKGLKAYGGDRWKSIAICKAASIIDHDNSLLSGNSTTTMLELIGTKFGEVEIQLFKDLKHQHDFSLINPIFSYDRGVNVITGHSGLDRLAEKLGDVLSFTIKIDQELKNYSEGKLVATYKANGEAKMNWGFNGDYKGKIGGKGKMELTTCIKYDQCEATPCTSTCDLNAFTTGDGELRIDACNNNEITLFFVGYSPGVGGFGGPGREHWTSCCGEYPGGECSTTRLSDQRNGEVTKMGQYTDGVLAEMGISPPPSEWFKPDGHSDKFIMPLQNNGPVIGTLKISQISKNKEWVLKLDITVMHTPK